MVLLVSCFLVLGTLFNGYLHHLHASSAAAASTSNVLYDALASASLASSALRGGHKGAGSVPQAQGPLKYLAFVPLLGMKTKDRGSLESERLAFKAWDALATDVEEMDGIELRVVGMVEDAAHCDPELFFPAMASGAVSCVALDPACRHAEFDGIPTLDCILDTARGLGEAWGADVYILANGDVIFTPTLTTSVAFAYDMFGPGTMTTADGSSSSSSLSPGRGFALVGQRIDLNVTLPDGPDDPPLTEKSLLGEDVEVRLHPPTGIDYFAFTPNVFPRDFPAYLIGRWRWDNALMLHFLLSDAVTIDASEVVHALHLGMGAYHSKQHAARHGGDYNDALVARATGWAHNLGRIDHTTYMLKSQGRKEAEEDEMAAAAAATTSRRQRTTKRENPLSLALERRVNPMVHAQLAALRVMGGGVPYGDEQAAVILLPVPVGEKPQALEWICRARHAGLSRYVLVTADRVDAEALEAALLEEAKGTAGAVVHMDPRHLSVPGWKGSKDYFTQKKTGQASVSVLALGMGLLIRRLLRLELPVMLMSSLGYMPWPSATAEEDSCDVAVWQDAQKEEDDGFAYARIWPSVEIVKQWPDLVGECLEEDVRRSQSHRGWCLTVLPGSCRFEAPAAGSGSGDAREQWWDTVTSQCRSEEEEREHEEVRTAIARALEGRRR